MRRNKAIANCVLQIAFYVLTFIALKIVFFALTGNLRPIPVIAPKYLTVRYIKVSSQSILANLLIPPAIRGRSTVSKAIIEMLVIFVALNLF